MSAPGPGPRLVPPPGPEAGEASPARPGVRSGRLLALALAALVVALGYGGWQARRATALEAEAAALAASLHAAQAEIEAHRRHLGSIREGVAELRRSLDALQAVADRSPGAPPDPETPAAPPGR